MAINKRFTQLNNSGSNHSILDAESAYITGTLQVGPAVPALGTDVNFFVSGNIGGKDGLTPGVGVFGGDLVVSGAIWALSGVQGVNSYWDSETAGEIFTSASLVNVPSGSVHAQFLSSSNGAEITGSVTFSVVGAGQSVVVSGAANSIPAFEVVNTAFGPGNEYSMFQVDPTNFSVKAITTDPLNYVEMDLNNPSLDVVSGSDHQITLNASLDVIGITVSGSAAAISIYDNAITASGDLDLQIRALKLNGDAGTAGYVLTSSGTGAAPGWAPVATPSIASEYWFSSGSGAIATTGSVALVGADYANLAYDTASDYGADIFLYVSGDIYGKTNSLQGVAVFGGDTVVSGTLFADNKLKVYDGPGGPILELDNGPGQASFYVSITGSSGMLLTGVLNASPAGTGRGLLKFGGLDIGPITGSVTLITPNPGDWILSGSILSASFGVWDGTNAAVVRHEFHILGIGTDSGGGVQTFAATYLVMSNISTTGVQTVAVGGVTELSRETSGSYAAAWDVNVTADCLIEVSASIDAGNVQWYAQRVKEMSLNTGGSRT